MCVCSSHFCTNLLAFLLSVMAEVGPCHHHVCGFPAYRIMSQNQLLSLYVVFSQLFCNSGR